MEREMFRHDPYQTHVSHPCYTLDPHLPELPLFNCLASSRNSVLFEEFLTLQTDQCNRVYSQFTSRMVSISENKMNIWISLCNVRCLNGMLNISLEIFPEKDALTEKKILNTWETILLFLKHFKIL